MKKKILSEAFKWGVRQRQGNDGKPFYVVYIDPQLSQNTIAVKDELKNRFRLRWDTMKKCWYLNVSEADATDNAKLEAKMRPIIEFLEQHSEEKGVTPEDQNTNINNEFQNILSQIETILNGINNGQVQVQNPEKFNSKELQSKLESYKAELIASFQDGTFKEKMGPIIKFRQAQGTSYSIGNCILIYLQKPDAKMVKSRKKWAHSNKNVINGAKPIAMWCPIGEREATPEERKEIEQKFLAKAAKKYGHPVTKKDLNQGEWEKLIDAQNKTVASSFKLVDAFYDISDTVQMEGKEDVIGNLDGIKDVEWFDNTTPEDEKSIRLYNAILETIQSFGIKVTYSNEQDLGGARGQSVGGEIKVLENAPKNIGTVSTLIHELSHEMLHQSYLRTRKEEFKSFFVGRPEGRELVEQQAEISAWIVLRYFGYDMKQAVNYAACWGADEKNAAFVMDSVASVAGKIINEMNENMLTMNESASAQITGLSVAEMLGPDAVEAYNKSKRMEVTDGFNEKGLYIQTNNFTNLYMNTTCISLRLFRSLKEKKMRKIIINTLITLLL